MTRIFLTAFVVVLLLLCFSIATMADATNWFIELATTNQNGMYTAGDCTIGWYNNYTDNMENGEAFKPLLPPVGGRNVAIASIIADGSYSLRDIRTPYSLNPALPKAWNFMIYTQGAWSPTDSIVVTIKPSLNSTELFPRMPEGTSVVFRGAYNAVFTEGEFALKTTPWTFTIPSVDSNGTLYTAINPVYL